MELSKLERLAIDTILHAKPGWPPESELIAKGVPVEVLAELRDRGVVVPWDRPGLPRSWTLTLLAAARLSVELEEWSGCGRARWTPIPRDDPRRCRGFRGSSRLARIDAAVVVDPRPGPLAQLLNDEWNGRPLRLFAGSVRSRRIDPIRLRATTRPDRVSRAGEPLKGGLGTEPFDALGIDVAPDAPGQCRRRRLLVSSLIASHGNGHANGQTNGDGHCAAILEPAPEPMGSPCGIGY